jgi:hypothetical protein
MVRLLDAGFVDSRVSLRSESPYFCDFECIFERRRWVAVKRREMEIEWIVIRPVSFHFLEWGRHEAQRGRPLQGQDQARVRGVPALNFNLSIAATIRFTQAWSISPLTRVAT